MSLLERLTKLRKQNNYTQEALACIPANNIEVGKVMLYLMS
jgi:DNA-binding XRE family transcriptional regulator